MQHNCMDCGRRCDCPAQAPEECAGCDRPSCLASLGAFESSILDDEDLEIETGEVEPIDDDEVLRSIFIQGRDI